MSSQTFEYLKNNKSIIVQAGAGAGKTTELTELVYKYLNNFYSKNKTWPKIVVCTFTRKATHELRERVMKKALQENDLQVLKFVQTSPDLQITTLHGIFLRYLKTSGGLINLSNNFKVCEDYELVKDYKFVFQNLIKTDKQFSTIYDNLIATISVSELINYFISHMQFKFYCTNLESINLENLMLELNEQVKKLQKDISELLQIIDDANQKVWRDWLLALSFTDKSVKQLSENNLDSFFMQLREHKPPRITKSTDPACIELKESICDRIAKILKHHNYLNFSKNINCHRTFDYCSDKFVNAWLERLVSVNKLPINCIELATMLCVQKDEAATQAFSKQWNVWFVDEYQDTSLIQTKILDKLIGHSSRYLVGDPQQSIYLFRGANENVFSNKQKSIANAQGLLKEKLINYRSNSGVLDFINSLAVVLGKKFKQMQFPGSDDDSKLIDFGGSAPVTFFQSASAKAEQTVIVDQILALNRLVNDLAEICILARTNKDLYEIANVLKQNNVPVFVNQSDSFLLKQEVQDVLSVLRFLVTPDDSLNLIRLCGSPWINIDYNQIHKQKNISLWAALSQNDSNASVQELKQALKLKETLGELKVWWYLVQRYKIISYYQNLDQTGQAVANIWKIYEDVSSRQKSESSFSFNAFFEKITTQIKQNSSIQQAVPIEFTNNEAQSGFVQLMTIHASKGLQFKHVFLIGCNKPYRFQNAGFWIAEDENGLWSVLSENIDKSQDQVSFKNFVYHNIENNLKQKEIEEYYRLLYVAVTRAIVSIKLFSVGKISNNSWSEKINQIPDSNFLQKRQLRDSTETELTFETKQVVKQEPSSKNVSIPDLINKNAATDQSISYTKRKNVNKESENLNIESLMKIQKGISIHSHLERSSQLTDAALKSHFEKFENGLLLNVHQKGFKEWSFSYLFEQQKIRGQIDLWYKDSNNHVYVVDYKTGSQAYIEKAFQQLRFYAFALHKLKKVNLSDKISLIVTFPLEGVSEKREAPEFQELEKEISNFLSDISD